MWNVPTTTQFLKDLSRPTEPGELVRLFFDHVRRGTDVHRALVLSRADLSAPYFRVVYDVGADTPPQPEADTSPAGLRAGGLLAALLYLGQLRDIPDLETDESDPAADLLRGGRSLMAFPLFDRGVNTGMVVALGASPRPHDASLLCSLATANALLGRAIESQKLVSRLEEARRELDRELKAAADVQRWLLPSLPAVAGVTVAASYRAARYAGGDYYDAGVLANGKLGVPIADVSGKGAAAAVLMAVVRSIVHDEVDRATRTSPAQLLQYADGRLRALGLPERGAFVTAFCATLDPADGTLTYSCAGHPPPRVRRKGLRAITSLDGAGTYPLGLVNDPHTHAEETASLAPGDVALFYSDGITEARSPDGDTFGIERLDDALLALPDQASPDAAVRSINDAVTRFSGEGPPADDQTVLSFGRHVR